MGPPIHATFQRFPVFWLAFVEWMKSMKGRHTNRRVVVVRRLLAATLLCSLAIIVALCFVRIDEHYICRGIIRPADDLTVYAPEDGVLEEVLIREDQFVEAGQPLFRLDTFDLRQRRALLEAEQRELQAQLALQEKHVRTVAETTLPEWLRFSEIDSRRSQNIVEYRRQVLGMLDRLQSGGLISRIEHDRAKFELEQAEADLERNQVKESSVSPDYIKSALDEARAQTEVTRARLENLATDFALLDEQLERRVLTAAQPGTVTLVLTREPGQKVAQGQELAQLATSKALELHLYGGERNVHKVRPGMRVQFASETFSPWTEGYCFATVELVSPDSDLAVREALGDGRHAQYFLKARVNETPAPLKLGATVRAEVLMGRSSIFKVLFNLE